MLFSDVFLNYKFSVGNTQNQLLISKNDGGFFHE